MRTVQIGRRLSTLQLIQQFIPDYEAEELDDDDEAGRGTTISDLLNAGLADPSKYSSPRFQKIIGEFVRYVCRERRQDFESCMARSGIKVANQGRKPKGTDSSAQVVEAAKPNYLGLNPSPVEARPLPPLKPARSEAEPVEAVASGSSGSTGGGASRGLVIPDEAEPASEEAVPEALPDSQINYDKCFARALLVNAKAEQDRWSNRWGSQGSCAKAVRLMLERMGFPSPGQPRNAIDYHDRAASSRPGHLAAMGFTNVLPELESSLRKSESEVSDQELIAAAPPGAILVFSGPKTASYLLNGRIRSRRAGNYVGHITVKASNDLFYTDGRTERAAGRRRYLAGIYIQKAGSSYNSAVRSQVNRACPGGGD